MGRVFAPAGIPAKESVREGNTLPHFSRSCASGSTKPGKSANYPDE
jgi:hypothetical protein